MNEIPLDHIRVNKPKLAAVISTSVYFQKSRKTYKKQTIKKEASQSNILDGRNSLNRYVFLSYFYSYLKVQQKANRRPLLDMRKASEIARETACTKISKIDLQVRKHCMKKKGMKNAGKSIMSSYDSGFKKLFKDGFTGSFKTEITEESAKEEERDTRNTSKEYKNENVEFEVIDKKEFDVDSALDGSFLYADLDLGEKKESYKNERKVSEKITTRVYKTLASNLKRIFKNDKTYG